MKFAMKSLLPCIYLMRHGETEWSLSGQHTGRADILLTENGETEARGIGEQVLGVTFRHVLVSPLQRAKQTCIYAGFGEKALIEPDLLEWHNGEYEGRTHKEIEKLSPGWNLFRDGCPAGESPQQISDRADHLISKLKAMDGNVALFSHGHFGRVLGARWIGLSVEFAERLLLDTASVSILSYQHGNFNQPAISLWNSVRNAPSSFLGNTRWGIAKSTNETAKRTALERWENEGGTGNAAMLDSIPCSIIYEVIDGAAILNPLRAGTPLKVIHDR